MTSADWMQVAAASVTFLLAIATAVMAYQTRRMADATHRVAEASHDMADATSDLVALERARRRDETGARLRVHSWNEVGEDHDPRSRLRVYLWNDGPGRARQVRCEVRHVGEYFRSEPELWIDPTPERVASLVVPRATDSQLSGPPTDDDLEWEAASTKHSLVRLGRIAGDDDEVRTSGWTRVRL